MKISENISLINVSDTGLCRPADPTDCFTVALYIKAELQYIIKPVYSLVLEVEVRNNDLIFTGKVINNQLFFNFIV